MNNDFKKLIETISDDQIKTKEHLRNIEQELQSLGMDFDVLVSYIKHLRHIVKDHPEDLNNQLKDLDWSYYDRYGNIAGLFPEVKRSK